MTLAETLAASAVFGIANAAHCAGMCGVFAAGASGLGRFTAYAAGKTATYAAIGAVAGSAGAAALTSAGAPQAWLGLAAGVVTLVVGVRTLLPPRPAADGAWAALLTPLTSAVARARAARSTFVLGAATGLLPCGVVYAAAAQSAAAASPVHGALAMTAFGLGTVPVLAVTSLVGRGALLRFGPSRVRTAGAILVLVTGIVMTVRSGLPLLHAGGGDGTPSCH